MSYDLVVDGDRFLIEKDQELRLQCCDCGLTHSIFFKKSSRGILVQIDRNDKATTKLRRHNQFARK